MTRSPTATFQSSRSSSKEKKGPRLADVAVKSVDLEVQSNSDDGDDPFATKGDDTINYRSVGWISATILMSKSQIGVGVLSIPSSLEVLGIIPGVLILLLFALVTTWSDIYIGIFKLKHPQVYSIPDCMGLVFGRVGWWITSVIYWLFCTMICGSAILTLSTGLNAITLHATCTAVFVAVAAIITLLLASVRTLEKIRFLGWGGIVSIMAALLILVIGVATGGRPSLAPPAPEPFEIKVVIFGSPEFAASLNACSNLFWAFTGTSAFLPIASEMKSVREYKKAVCSAQAFVTSVYLTVGIVVYYYAGQYVASPALGTAGVLLKRVGYGVSLIGLIFTAVFYAHLPAKFLFVAILGKTKHLTTPTKTHWIVWLSCTTGCAVFSWLIASVIPVFGGLVGLAGALFGTLLSLHAEAIMYIYDNRLWFKHKDYRTRGRTAGILANFAILFFGSFLTVAGTYGSIIAIQDGYAAGGTKPFTCADNSGSS